MDTAVDLVITGPTTALAGCHSTWLETMPFWSYTTDETIMGWVLESFAASQ